MKKKSSLLFAFILIFSIAAGLFYPVTADAAAKKPKLNIKKLDMIINSDFTLRVYNLKKKQKVTYTSSNPEIAAVTAKGKIGKRAAVTAVSIGKCDINVTVKRGKKVVRRLKCKVKVSPSAISIKFLRKNVYLQPDSKQLLKTIIKPNTSNEQPLYECDNIDVVTVNSRGVVTAVAPGTATITATLLSTGQTATCTVTVGEKKEKTEDVSTGFTNPKKKSNFTYLPME